VSLSKLPSRTNFVDLVYTNLRDAISDGTLHPGERITQEDLATRLNVSRSPVLQALRLLKKEGLLEEAPGRGLIVTRLNPERIGHLYQIRGALDGLAAKLAAERQQTIPLTLIEHGRQVSRGADVHLMIDADMAFHQAIYEASGNPLIAENAYLHWVHFRLLMGAVLQRSTSREGIWDEHEAIAKAINRGDTALASKLSEQHAEVARRVLIGQFKAIESAELQPA
jgi:DNA-binding GntR family transcriptional regulator